MAASVVRHRRLLLALVAAAALATALVVLARHAGQAPAGDARRAPAQSVLVVRSAGGHDALWLLSPVDGTPTAAGDLPGVAAAVAVSPGGTNVAYLSQTYGPRVWIGYGPLAPKTISLAGTGVRRVDSFTWIDDHRLIVAGAGRATAGISQDRLYLVNAATGRAASFRSLRGTEPSLTPGGAKVVYAKVTVVEPGTAANHQTATMRESVREVRLSGGTGRTLLSTTYRTWAEFRAFARPQLSADGRWLLTTQTGSDPSATFSVRLGTGTPLISVFTFSLGAQSGWDAAGRTAFAGTPTTDSLGEACVWVCDPVRGTLERTAAGLLPQLMVTGLAWSAGGDLVAGALGWGVTPQSRHVIVLPGGLTTKVDLGRGRLPVWVTP